MSMILAFHHDINKFSLGQICTERTVDINRCVLYSMLLLLLRVGRCVLFISETRRLLSQLS